MATIAGIGAWDMRGGWLAAGDNAVVTTDTGPSHLRVIHRAFGYRLPGNRGIFVTGLAQITT